MPPQLLDVDVAATYAEERVQEAQHCRRVRGVSPRVSLRLTLASALEATANYLRISNRAGCAQDIVRLRGAA
jgi:hypothetical protein